MDLRDTISSASGDPKKILKIVIGLAVLMLLVWIFMVSRMEFSGSSSEQIIDTTQQQRTENLRNSLRTPAEALEQAEESEERSSSVFFNAFTTFLVLIAILALVWFWIRSKSPAVDERGLREIGMHSLGPGTQLRIVELNGEIWVLGVATGGVNLLHRCPKEEWRDELPAEKARDESSFHSLFKRKT
ncbi:MAG: flagellar biosynthetic protein FliO [Balneolaceae bacterium]